MKLYFTEEDIKEEKNLFLFEEDNLHLTGEYIEGEGKEYHLFGSATIEEERYPLFEIVFILINEPKEQTIASILEEEWDWYDFVF